MVSACTGLGLTQSQKLNKRVQTLEKIILLINYVISSIKYSNENFSTIFYNASQKEEFKILSFLTFEDEINSEPFYLMLQQNIEHFRKLKLLNTSELDDLTSMFQSLGNMDSQGEIAKLEHYRTLFNDYLVTARTDVSEKGKLYKTLGVLSGAAVFILLV